MSSFQFENIITNGFVFKYFKCEVCPFQKRHRQKRHEFAPSNVIATKQSLSGNDFKAFFRYMRDKVAGIITVSESINVAFWLTQKSKQDILLNHVPISDTPLSTSGI